MKAHAGMRTAGMERAFIGWGRNGGQWNSKLR